MFYIYVIYMLYVGQKLYKAYVKMLFPIYRQ